MQKGAQRVPNHAHERFWGLCVDPGSLGAHLCALGVHLCARMHLCALGVQLCARGMHLCALGMHLCVLGMRLCGLGVHLSALGMHLGGRGVGRWELGSRSLALYNYTSRGLPSGQLPTHRP